MEKNQKWHSLLYKLCMPRKLVMIMRISFILLFAVMLQVSASSVAQKVVIKQSKITYEKLFEEIEAQTGIATLLSNRELNLQDQIVLESKDFELEDLLKVATENTQITFEIIDDYIIIRPVEQAEQDNESQQNQSIVISGVVTDESGETLPGVNVMVKNGVLGTITDINGRFELKTPDQVKVLVFSFIGFKTQEVEVQGQTTLQVQMIADVQELGDVVVTGYQVIDKRELTSSIASVEADDLEILGSLSVDRMLEGKATGLMITNLSSTPGAAAKVRVRGGSTFTGNQSPLWVIDGVIYEDPVPLSADDINSFDNINLIGNALTGVNPSDIAKIDILKDASATAIYGTRAANGVIVITTKRGTDSEPVFTYSGGLSVVRAPQYSDFELMNSKERIDVSREMYQRNIGTIGTEKNIDRLGYEGALMNLWDGTYSYNQFQDQVSYLETLNADWFGELYQTAITQKHSVSASGGSKRSRYYFSVGYDDQQGTEKGVDLQRITAMSKLDLDLRENLLVSFKVSGSVQEATYNHSSVSAFDEAYYTSRTTPVYDEDGELFYVSKKLNASSAGISYGNYNVLNEMENSERNITNKDFTISANLNWKFLDNFRFTALASYRNTTNLTEEWITENTFYIANLRTYDAFEDMVENTVDMYASVPFGGLYTGGMVSSNAYNLRSQLNYNKVLQDKHVFNVNLGHEVRSNQYWGAQGFTVPGYDHYYGRGFITLDSPGYESTDNGIQYNFGDYYYDNMINWLTSKGQSVYPNITDRLSNTLSVFGIFNYVYDNRYIVNFNVRSDGSNTFGQHERYKFKPTWSVSGRWNIHNERFWNNGGKVDELAFRASYGVRGTMPNTTPYLIISNYNRELASIYGTEFTADLSSFPNANLRWEKTETVNLGLNYSMFKGRISGAFDYAYSKSTDLIQQKGVSLVNGSSTQEYNIGAKDVSSYEFSIRTVNIKRKDFGWSTNFNFSYDKDRVLEGFEDGASSDGLTASDYLRGSIYRTGFPTNGFFSYQFDGLDEEGLPTFVGLKDEYDTPEEQLEAMLVYEGSRVPLYYGSFGTQIRYRNLRLSAHFNYKLGYKTRLLKLYNGSQNVPFSYENMSSAFNNRWRQAGDEQYTDIPSLSSDNLGYPSSEVEFYDYVLPSGNNNGWYMYDMSDARVVKGDHIRLTSLTLSYNMPKNLIDKAGIKNMTVGVQASNVAVWAFDKKLKGQDPEQVNSIGMPSLPTYSLSLNLSF
ncbi:SusC/RagA family TonB-linked outer membrane protein [Carboxylicivirga sp. A043]|uniref:SusC/RagA family TonB-linked outer membrane protein n=1 Tax=Carboxylicivirga litoralis TaxID=2816963 RepID=UPI0021CB856A|nr:SusC/RagA family TonB-linked outer membrane protein [Carboxylicivirga sp. A043]MCU4155856.1 SusC/RagA family TonB-linked outer membrane protein [Carboxylicivirga sp. A043]